jgi:hypothetical protein
MVSKARAAQGTFAIDLSSLRRVVGLARLYAVHLIQLDRYKRKQAKAGRRNRCGT